MALPGGVWGVADFVGAEPTATLGLAVLRKGGRYVVVGLYGGEVPVSLVPLAVAFLLRVRVVVEIDTT